MILVSSEALYCINEYRLNKWSYNNWHCSHNAVKLVSFNIFLCIAATLFRTSRSDSTELKISPSKSGRECCGFRQLQKCLFPSHCSAFSPHMTHLHKDLMGFTDVQVVEMMGERSISVDLYHEVQVWFLWREVGGWCQVLIYWSVRPHNLSVWAKMIIKENVL